MKVGDIVEIKTNIGEYTAKIGSILNDRIYMDGWCESGEYRSNESYLLFKDIRSINVSNRTSVKPCIEDIKPGEKFRHGSNAIYTRIQPNNSIGTTKYLYIDECYQICGSDVNFEVTKV